MPDPQENVRRDGFVDGTRDESRGRSRNGSRYARLLQKMIADAGPVACDRESVNALQVERGGMLAVEAATGDVSGTASSAAERLVDVATSASLEDVRVIDRLGHTRAVYRPLLIYCWLTWLEAGRKSNPTDERKTDATPRAWYGSLEKTVRSFDISNGAIAAARGSEAGAAAWSALALHVGGNKRRQNPQRELSDEFFRRLASAQQRDGAFLVAGASDSPETHWYDELVILHAAASFAMRTGNERVAAACEKNAIYHLHETQPDHATSQPWGLHAFAASATAYVLADQMIHAVDVQYTGGVSGICIDGVSLMLLADALYCLKLRAVRDVRPESPD